MHAISERPSAIGRLALALVAIHSTATLELALAMARQGPNAVPGWLDLLSAWAGSMLVAAAFFGILYILIAVPLRAIRRDTGFPAAAAAAAAMACPILLAAFTGSAASALFDPVRGSVTLAVAFGSAAAAYLIARVVDFETSEGSQFAKALLMTPLPLALVVCLIWLRLSYLRTELAFIAPAYWALLTLLLVVAATVFLWNRNLPQFVPRALSAWSVVLVIAFAWQAFAPQPAMRKLSAATPGNQKIRHVILITIDTLRADALSRGLSPHCESPVLDALAQESINFKSAYAPSPWTPPSVASIMSGLSPTVHGVGRQRTHFPVSPPTLPDFFREAGYLTAAFGGNTLLAPQYALYRNSDVFRFPEPQPPRTLARQALAWYRGPIRMSDQHRTEDITADAQEWIRLYAEQNFFLWLHYFDPHAPYLPPPEFLADHDQDRLYRVALAFDEDRGRARLSPPPPLRQFLLRSLYCGEVQYVDNRIGRVIEDLKQRGIYDDALIVVTSDHGEEFWEHGNAFHGHSMLDELLRVPLIFKLPGQAMRMAIQEPVSNVAVMPSILDLAEIEFDPTQFSNQPLKRFWDGRQPSPEFPPVFAGHNFLGGEQEAIVSGGWKYVQHANSQMNQLYNLTEDTEERVNRLHSEPALAKRFRALIEEHHEASAALRERIGIGGRPPLHIQKEMQRRLRSLGYIQ